MFEHVFGHEIITRNLERMITRDRLHHGLLFHGPNGIGKKLIGRATAKAMLCEKRTGCDACRHCQKLDGGNHPDYREVSPDGLDIKVQQIRDITENLHFKPFEGRARFILLDDADKMREGAANAFLKTLEEPPDYVYFILITSDINALLPTILSRCQKIGFQSLRVADKSDILVKRFNVEEELAQKLAHISFRQLETEEVAWAHFQEDIQLCLNYLMSIHDHGHALDLLSEIVREKQEFPRFLDHFTVCLRELSLLARGIQGQMIFESFQPAMKKLLEKHPAHLWRELWQEVMGLISKRRMNPNLALWFNATSVEALGQLQLSEQNLRARFKRT